MSAGTSQQDNQIIEQMNENHEILNPEEEGFWGGGWFQFPQRLLSPEEEARRQAIEMRHQEIIQERERCNNFLEQRRLNVPQTTQQALRKQREIIQTVGFYQNFQKKTYLQEKIASLGSHCLTNKFPSGIWSTKDKLDWQYFFLENQQICALVGAREINDNREFQHKCEPLLVLLDDHLMCVCTKYNYAFYESVKLNSEQETLLEMSPSKPGQSARKALFNHHCYDDIIFLIEESEIIEIMEVERRGFIEAEKHEHLNWDGNYHVHRAQLWEDAKQYQQRNPKVDMWDL